MSEDPNAAAGAAGDTGAAPEVEENLGTTPATDAPLGGDVGGDEAPSNASPALPDNWRELLANGDEQVLRELTRYKPENVGKALRDAKVRLRTGQVLPVLADDATPEDVAAYRKAAGVPETPEAYDFQFPPEVGSAEHSKAVLDSFKAFMHENHIGANDRGARKAFEFYTQAMVQGQAAREQAMEEARQESIAELRGAWPGREFTRNTRLAEELLKGEGAFAHFEEPLFDESASSLIRNARVTMQDGREVELRLFPPFVKGIVNLARKLADAEALIGGDGAGGGQSIEAERQAILDKPYSTRSPAEHKRLDEIYGALYPEPGARRGRAA